MNEKIRFAVIGCGNIGRKHAEVITANPDAELVSLVDILPRDALGIEAFDVPYFDSLEDFLASEIRADVVNIATPNGLHFEQAAKVLKSGMHAVVEKPMAINTEDARELVKISKDTGRKIFMVMQNRYSKTVQWLKRLVESGQLGEVYIVQVNCYWNRDSRYYFPGSWHGSGSLDGGTLYTQFSHFIDIMYWIFGDIKNIGARFADFNHGATTDFEDSGFITFDFQKSGTGSFNFSTSVWNENLESSITVIAENGSLKIGGQYMDKIEICKVKGCEQPKLGNMAPNYDYGGYKGSAANHSDVIQNVIDVLKGAAEIQTPAEDGAMVVDIIGRIYAAGNRMPFSAKDSAAHN